MKVNSMRDVALAAKGRRLDLDLTQAELAKRIGVSRKWIYEFEAVKPKVEFGLVLRVLEELEIDMELNTPVEGLAASGPTNDLNELLAELNPLGDPPTGDSISDE